MKMKLLFASVLALASTQVFAADASSNDLGTQLIINHVRTSTITTAEALNLNVTETELQNHTDLSSAGHEICIFDNSGEFHVRVDGSYNDDGAANKAGFKLGNNVDQALSYSVEVTSTPYVQNFGGAGGVVQGANYLVQESSTANPLEMKPDCTGAGDKTIYTIHIPYDSYKEVDAGTYNGTLKFTVTDIS